MQICLARDTPETVNELLEGSLCCNDNCCAHNAMQRQLLRTQHNATTTAAHTTLSLSPIGLQPPPLAEPWCCTPQPQQLTDVMQVQAVMVVAGHTLEEGIAVLGGAKAGLDGLACMQNTHTHTCVSLVFCLPCFILLCVNTRTKPQQQVWQQLCSAGQQLQSAHRRSALPTHNCCAGSGMRARVCSCAVPLEQSCQRCGAAPAAARYA